jgi:signal transduction histidine kinase
MSVNQALLTGVTLRDKLIQELVLSLQRGLILIVVLSLLVPGFLVTGWQTIDAFKQMERRFAADQSRALGSLVWSLGEPVWSVDVASARPLLQGALSDPRVVRISVSTNVSGSFAEVQDLSRDHGKTVSLDAEILRNHEVIGQVSLTMDKTLDVDEVGARSGWMFGEVMVQLAISVALLLVTLRRRFVRPLQVLEKQAALLSRNQLEQVFEWSRDDELGHLGASLEQTRLALKESFTLLEARVSERTRDLEAFSYSVSHDLRAPLRSIHGFAQALEADLGGEIDPQARKDLAHIHRGVAKMSQLIEDLLALSMVTRIEMRQGQVNLLALAKTLWNDLEEREPGRNLKLQVRGNFLVAGDQSLLEIALRNLLGNAWKYTSKTPHAEVWLEELITGDERWFAVTDNGPGFPAERSEELFEPFFRLFGESEFPGNGIGLAMVRRIVDRHGGTIKAEALAEGGARFRFSLATQR